MSSYYIDITATTLYFKFCQQGTIVSSYQNAHNLPVTTTGGFDFPQLPLEQIHPILAVKILQRLTYQNTMTAGNHIELYTS